MLLNVKGWNGIFSALYPRCPVSIRDKTVALLIKKEIHVNVDDAVENILASVIRHNNTHYHGLLQRVEKEQARRLMNPLVTKDINYYKGGRE